MKIVIINPPALNTVVENPDDKGEEFLEADSFGDFPPLGALYVLTHLEEKTTGHELFFKDCVGERWNHDDVYEWFEEIKPDIVGITSFTVGLVDVCMVAEAAHKVNPDCHVCLGGHHPIAYPVEAAQLPMMDSVVVGEGEIAFTELVNCLEKGEDFTHIKGVYTKESIKKHADNPIRDIRFLRRVTVPAGYIDDMEDLPHVNRKWIRHIPYQSILGVTKDLATIISSRGCPFKCTFCDVPIKSYRQRSPQDVCDEIEQCLEQGYTEFRFYDDLFNINERKIIEFCDELDRRGLDIIWDFRGRVNTVTKYSLERAKASGLRMIAFGVETGTDEGLKILRKATTTEKIRNAFKWCRELGILTVADYIIGHPFEKTPEDVMENIDFLIDLDPDYAQISVLKLYPNTEMYDNAISEKVIPPNRWHEFVLDPHKGFIVDHWDEHMPLETLVKLQKRAYRKFYFRPAYILRSAFKTASFAELGSKVFGASKLLVTNLKRA